MKRTNSFTIEYADGITGHIAAFHALKRSNTPTSAQYPHVHAGRTVALMR
jgi:hypothetical protein